MLLRLVELTIPEMTPVVVESESPGGKLPDASFQLYGDEPPLACKACEYGAPSVTAGIVGTVTLSALGATAIENVAVADWLGLLLSVTFTAKLDAPLELGVPEITPAEDSVSPAGSDPEEMLH